MKFLLQWDWAGQSFLTNGKRPKCQSKGGVRFILSRKMTEQRQGPTLGVRF